jgi:YidC/Oxa1 family membrane protein insertase
MLDHILDYLRLGLYLLLALLGYHLYQAWQLSEFANVSTKPDSQISVTPPNQSPIINNTATTNSITTKSLNISPNAPLIHAKTDVLEIDIDPHGGNIIGSKLLKYPAELGSLTPYSLLNNDPQKRYITTSGMISANLAEAAQDSALYSTAKTQYTLANQQNSLSIILHGPLYNGIQINKEIILQRDSYLVTVNYILINHSKQAWQGKLYYQLLRTDTATAKDFANLTTYFGAAISSHDKPLQKISFKEMRQQNLHANITGGWAAMVQHYFVSAWIPQQHSSNEYYSKITPDGLYTIGMLSDIINIAPQQQTTVTTHLYTGPAVADYLEQAAPGLQLTIDYGMLWMIAAGIFWLMKHTYNLIGNWGGAIIITTIIIKLLFYQLSAKSYRSMNMMKKIQPKIEHLKELHANNKQQLTQATLALYRQEKINPMGGCLPMLIQIPVFIALYWVLVESVQLRQAPFILWITDLTAKDPYYVLPILVGMSMFLQQRLSPPPPDPTQAKLMLLMPVIFTCLFISCPAGLMLYWFVNNLLSCLQQWLIIRSIK